MAIVELGFDFFLKERNTLYANWERAFWRELLQNSIDAGAKRIDISINQGENNTVQIIFDDDGIGMDLETLEDVYFVFGETTKNENDIGGYGRARALIFACKKYFMETRNLCVEGRGTMYQIYSGGDYKKGVKLSCDVNGTNLETLRSELETELNLSQINNCKIYINDVEYNSWTRKNQYVRDLVLNNIPFAKVYVNKSSNIKNKVIVRIDGLLMFVKTTRVGAQIVLEINKENSKNVLTASRDGLIFDYSVVLEKFLSELAIDTNSAIKPKFTNKNHVFKGVGLNYSHNFKLKNVNQVQKIENTVLEANFSLEPDNKIEHYESMAEKYTNSLDIGNPIFDNIPTVCILVDTDNTEIHKVIKNYYPDNWVNTLVNGKVVKKGARMLKLILSYKIALEEAIRCYFTIMEKQNYETSFYWGLGWIFGSVEAKLFSSENGKFFMINPVDKIGNMKFKTNNKKDQKRIMALAKHEVAHLVEIYHDEQYANILTQIDSEYDEIDVYRQMKEITIEESI